MENWKSDLDAHFKEKKQTKKEQKEKKTEFEKSARRFIKKTAIAAFEELSEELARYKREAHLDHKKDWAALMVRHNKKKEFVYELSLNREGEHLAVSRSVYAPNDKGKLKLRIEGKLHTATNSARADKITSADIIADFLECYKEATRAH